MACALPESPTSVLRVELTCPVCLELYLEPHQLPCGHNFCLHCLQRLIRPQRAWFSCPECRVTCSSTDQLQKNFKLANIAHDYRNRHQGQGATSTRRGPSSRLVPLLARTPVMVLCDYCAPAAAPGAGACWDGNPRSSGATALAAKPAAKMCLKCEVMMCQEHLRPHLELPAFRDHPLTDPTEFTDFRKRKCRDHDEIYSYYCMDEKTFVCNACIVEGGHKDHTIKTLRNATKDLKGALDHQLNTAERKSAITELKLLAENEKDRQNKNFVKMTENYMRGLRAEMHVKVDGFVDRLLGLTHDNCNLNALDIHKNIKKIKEDKVRLQEVRGGIQGLMSQNPFRFIEAYKRKEEQLQKKLQQRLFKPECVEGMKTGDLGVQMEGEMKAFLDMELHAIILADILTLCNFPEEEEEEGEEEEEEMDVEALEVILEEEEDKSSEEDEVGEEEDEVYDGGEEEDEGMSSEEDEEVALREDQVVVEEEEGTSSEEAEEEEATCSEEDEVGEEEEEGDDQNESVDQVDNPEDDDGEEEEDGDEEEELITEEEELTTDITDSEQDSDINQ